MPNPPKGGFASLNPPYEAAASGKIVIPVMFYRESGFLKPYPR